MAKTLSILVSLFTGFSTLAMAAPPPSDLTKSEVLWNELSMSASKDLGSKETQRLMDQYFTANQSEPKASLIRYLYGERLFKLGDYSSAAVAFEKFLLLNEDHPLADSAAFRLGECYYNMKVFNSAATAWERVVKSKKSSAFYPEALENLGLLEMRANEWGKADERFQKLAKEFPTIARLPRVRESQGVVKFHLQEYAECARLMEGLSSEKATYYRGLALFSMTLYEDAAGALKNASENAKGPFGESAAFVKAESFFQRKNYSLAIKEFDSFLTRYPTSSLVPYAELRKGASALLLKDRNGALASIDKVLKKEIPFEVKMHGIFLKGLTLLDEKNAKESRRLFQIVAERPEFPDLAAASLLRMAWADSLMKNSVEMEVDIKHLEEKFPTSSEITMGRFLQGAKLYESQKWEDAGSRFESVLLGRPYSVLSEASLALMSQAYTKAGRKDQLVTSANAALKILDNNFKSESIYWRAPAFYYIGRAYYDLGRWKEGIPFLEKMTTRFGDHELAPSAQLLLGWSYLNVGEFSKARQKAQVLIDNQKIDETLRINASFLVAASYFNAKDYDHALLSLSDFVKAHPKDPQAPQALYMMGLGYLQKKIMGSALDQWNRLIKEYPENPLAQEAYLHVATLYFKSEDYKQAAQNFNAFRSKWPKSPYSATAFWQELQCYFNSKDDDTAIKVYPAFIAQFSTSENVPSAQSQLEMVYYRRGAEGNPDKLQEFLGKYPKSPFAPAARYKLGDMALEQKAWNRAVQEMEQFVRDYPNDKLMTEALYGLGLAYENTGDVDKAMMQYRQIMDNFGAKPTAVDAAFRLGSVHFKNERYKEALEAFQFGVTRKMAGDLQSNFQYNLALCHERLGHFEEAAASYGKFAHLTKDVAQKRDALMNAGLLLKKAEKYDKAATYFQELLKDAGSPDLELQTVNWLAECYRSTAKENQAIATYERLVGMEPAASDARVAGLAQLAYMYEQKKDVKKAVGIYEKISISQGKAEWVDAAKQRITALTASLNPAP